MSDIPWTNRDYWEEAFQTGDTGWELGEPSPTLLMLEDRLFGKLSASEKEAIHAVVPGCGYGNDALAFARRGFHVTAVDWSPTAVEKLNKRAEDAGVKNRFDISQGDFWQISKSWNQQFDLWVEHTFFCALDPSLRERYVEAAARSLRPGAHLIGTVFITQDPQAKLALGGEGGPPFLTEQKNMQALFEKYFEFEVLERSPCPHPKRRPGIEWAMVLKRRG